MLRSNSKKLILEILKTGPTQENGLQRLSSPSFRSSQRLLRPSLLQDSRRLPPISWSPTLLRSLWYSLSLDLALLSGLCPMAPWVSCTVEHPFFMSHISSSSSSTLHPDSQTPKPNFSYFDFLPGLVEVRRIQYVLIRYSESCFNLLSNWIDRRWCCVWLLQCRGYRPGICFLRPCSSPRASCRATGWRIHSSESRSKYTQIWYEACPLLYWHKLDSGAGASISQAC